MRPLSIFAGTTFAATLAIVIGNRLPDDAMVLVLGMVLGILASVPVAIALLVVLDRHKESPSIEQAESTFSESTLSELFGASPSTPLSIKLPTPSPYYLPRDLLASYRR